MKDSKIFDAMVDKEIAEKEQLRAKRDALRVQVVQLRTALENLVNRVDDLGIEHYPMIAEEVNSARAVLTQTGGEK